MVFFYEIPIILILFIVLAVLGLEISGIIKWVLIISGIITILFGIFWGLDSWNEEEGVNAIITIIFGVLIIALAIYIGTLGSFSLYDILTWIL